VFLYDHFSSHIFLTFGLTKPWAMPGSFPSESSPNHI
jgi:hypothetical protein